MNKLFPFKKYQQSFTKKPNDYFRSYVIRKKLTICFAIKANLEKLKVKWNEKFHERVRKITALGTLTDRKKQQSREFLQRDGTQ